MKRFIQKNIIFIYVIPFFIILLIESIGYLFVPKISHHKIVAKAQSLIPKIDSNSIVILGDSRLEWGIKTDEIANRNGNVINLAMPGSNGFDIIKFFIRNNIYPQKIIIGFTPNYGRYKNHSLNMLHFSTKNSLKENIKYWLKQNSFTYDRNSIILFLKGEEPYFINHQYDNYGNVIVEENGDFNERMNHQLEMYTEWSKNFNIDEYRNYIKELKIFSSQLKGKSNFYGLYMPISDTICSLEIDHYYKTEVENLFDFYMDFSDFLSNNDSTYFYDGSHLNSEYAREFTKEVNKSIIKHERTIE